MDDLTGKLTLRKQLSENKADSVYTVSSFGLQKWMFYTVFCFFTLYYSTSEVTIVTDKLHLNVFADAK